MPPLSVILGKRPVTVFESYHSLSKFTIENDRDDFARLRKSDVRKCCIAQDPFPARA
jgi:hypothetical protein